MTNRSRAAVFGITLLTASCAALGLPTTVGGFTVASIQALAVKICSFEPTVNMVATLLATNNAGILAGVVAADDIALAICGLAVPKTALRRGTHNKVAIPEGMKAEGSFVR